MSLIKISIDALNVYKFPFAVEFIIYTYDYVYFISITEFSGSAYGKSARLSQGPSPNPVIVAF